MVIVLGALTALGPLTIDMYLPAFPAITESLGSTESAVQLTLTGSLIGVAVGQITVGPLSDAFGRRRPLVIAMAVVRDLFAGVSGVTMLSRLMLVTGVASILAPTLGAQLLRFTGWRGVFWALAVIGAVLIAVVAVGLRETLPPERRRRGGIGATMRTYGRLVQERTFVGLMLTGGLMMGGLFAYIAGSSFIMQDVYGLSEQDYGLLFGLNSAGLVLATQINAKVAVWYGPQRVLAVAVAVSGTAGIAPLVGVLGTSSAVPMASIMMPATIGAVAALYLIVRPFHLVLPSAEKPAVDAAV